MHDYPVDKLSDFDLTELALDFARDFQIIANRKRVKRLDYLRMAHSIATVPLSTDECV